MNPTEASMSSVATQPQSEATVATSPSNPELRAAVYYRVSTLDQRNECQKPDVERLVAAQGLNVVARYEEQASAAKHRPRFERMMSDAKAGKFKVLVIWALDRFGRSLGGNLNDFIALDKLGIRIISVQEPWMDSAGPIRELLVAIFSWAAQQERARLIERTKAGIAVSRANGTPWGRRSLGLVAESERPALVAQWVEEGRPDGLVGLATVLGCASATTARKIARAHGVDTSQPGDRKAAPATDDSTDPSPECP